jgi:hypothetical protein
MLQQPRVLKQFITYYKKGMLQRGDTFSVYYESHLQQAIILFELFYYANDWNTLYKVRNASGHVAGSKTNTITQETVRHIPRGKSGIKIRSET